MMRSAALRLALAAALFAATGCLPSSVVAPEDRDANLGLAIAESEWTALDADASALDGLWSSVSIEGDAGLALLRVFYHFTPDGAFTGAALLATDPPSFQVLSGTWELAPDGLRLGEGSPPARVEVAPDLIRLSGDEGTVVLRRERAF